MRQEYNYGAPSDWVTEIDGLRCFGDMGSIVSEACTDIERGIKDLNSGWLGTDPLRNDSDDHYWSGAQLLTQSRRGDGICCFCSLQGIHSGSNVITRK